jgi:hypothetical protein
VSDSACQLLQTFANLVSSLYFGVSCANGAGNTKISFLKARLRRAFKKLIIVIVRIAGIVAYWFAKTKLCVMICGSRSQMQIFAKIL